MTDQPIYVGIENEFQLMKGDVYLSFDQLFNSLLEKYDYNFFKRSNTAIRTSVGSSLYADGHEPEVCTSPVRVQKGFAQKAVDALYLARRELVELISSDKSLDLIGYSMHWNLTSPLQEVSRGEAMKALVVPYSLLALNPISSGINLREGKSGNRLELLADHISNEDQIKAFLLFYAGTMLNIEANIDQLPLLYLGNDDEVNNDGTPRYSNPVLDGRYTPIQVLVEGKETKTISAQQYLEVYVEFFRKGLEELATPEELRNLQDFVDGRKKLEIDKFKKYAFASIHKNENNLSLKYHPELCIEADSFTEERELPDSMSEFLGDCIEKTLVNERGEPLSLEKMEWEHIVLND